MATKKKIAVLFNTNQLGGAERSLIEQLALLPDREFQFFIPKLPGTDAQLLSLLEEKKFSAPEEIDYPRVLYSFSRSDLPRLILLPFFIPYFLIIALRWNKIFSPFDEFYANGNKATFPIFCWETFRRKKITLYWHFRDYPEGRFFKVILWCLKVSFLKDGPIDFFFIANSHSVAEAVEKIFKKKTISLYNVSGTIPQKIKTTEIKTIGIVSMIAPWKGLHTVVLMAGLHEKRLRELGVEKIKFFGDSIYLTRGAHQSYGEQLRRLSEKFPSGLIEWCGREKPQKIYSEIDLLIHPSCQPEPFGRVILEAFQAGLPVISTGLGGAGELIGREERGKLFPPHDERELLRKIEEFILISKERSLMCSRAQAFATDMETQVLRQLSDIF